MAVWGKQEDLDYLETNLWIHQSFLNALSLQNWQNNKNLFRKKQTDIQKSDLAIMF